MRLWRHRYLLLEAENIRGTPDAEVRVRVGPTRWGPWGWMVPTPEDIQDAKEMAKLAHGMIGGIGRGWRAVVAPKARKRRRR
jgi:hypothetical protein